MLEIKKIESTEQLSELKQQYFAQSTAPLDGMWHFGFAPMADHFGFYEQDKLVGFCCINGDGYLLQFYLNPNSQALASDLFTLIVEQNSSVIGKVSGAFVSTAEPQYLSLCLDNYKNFHVNGLMYQQMTTVTEEQSHPLAMTLATAEQLSAFVEFAVSNIGAPEQWITGYYTNLINRQELFGYWDGKQLVAAGECRLFDEYQTDNADLGMIVAQSERGKGVATRVLKFLVKLAKQKGLRPICSTEKGNIGAQKAITRAGLSASNRIIQFES